MNNHRHDQKSYGTEDIIKDLTEEDILYSVGISYGIGDGNDRSDFAKEVNHADLYHHIECMKEVVSA